MWAGFGVVGVIELFATLHGFFPAVPVIPFYFDLGPWVDQYPPWNAYRWKGIGLWPILISPCYLMPLDLAFSLWFFNLMFKAQLILASHFGWTTNPVTGFPYIDNQGLGGFIALLASVLWLDRHYLRQVAHRVLGLHSTLDDSSEPMGYRGAVLALAVAIGFLLYFFSRGGMAPPFTLFWAGHFLLLGLAATRIRAQLAPPIFELWWIGPSSSWSSLGSLLPTSLSG